MASGIQGLICYPRRRTFARDGIETPRLTRAAFSLAFAVCAAAPSRVAWDDLFALFWGARADGGALTWKTCLSVYQAAANRALAALGVRLAGRSCGFCLGGIAAVDLDRARGASDRGAAMGVAAPQHAPGLRPAKRAAQPLTNSRPARFPTGAPGRLTDQRGDTTGPDEPAVT